MAKKIKVSEQITTTTYLLDLHNGAVRKVDVPSNWKVTFGPTIPYSGKYTGRDGGTALRFYEGNKENLRAVFTDVIAFRDASIAVLDKKVSTQQKVVHEDTPQGGRNVVVTAVTSEWVDPNAESNEPNPMRKALAAPDIFQTAKFSVD